MFVVALGTAWFLVTRSRRVLWKAGAAALLCVLLFILLTARPHAFERGDFQLLPPVGYVALVERVRRPALATRALEAGVRARLFLRQRQTRPRAARRVAAPALDLDQQHLPREHDSFGHAQLRKRSAECGVPQ